MVAEEPGRDDRHDDADDIDARFEEIVAGLRAEQAASQQRRREAIRRAQTQRRGPGSEANHPLEGFDNPNPWPPRRRPPPGTNPPFTETPGSRSAGAPPPGTNPPVTGPPPTQPQDARPQDTGPQDTGPQDTRGRHRPASGRSAESDYPDPPAAGDDADPVPGSWRGWDAPDEEEHFIPPTPQLPAGDLHLWAIVAGLLGGPLILILSNVFTLLTAPWWTPVGILVSVAGVVLLVLRLPKSRDDTDFTGGAQV